MKKTFTLLAALFILFSIQAQKSELALNLEKGKEYLQVSDSKITMVQEIADQIIEIEMITKGTLSFFVNDITATGYDMDATFKSLGLTMKSPYLSVEFDSESKKEDDPYSKILTKMVNKPFKFKMTKEGKVIDLEGFEKIWNEVVNNFSEFQGVDLEQMKAQMEKAYGGEAMMGNMEMVTAIFPDEKVAIGEEWTINSNLNGGIPGAVSTVYKLVERNSDFILIRGEGNVNSYGMEELHENNDMPIVYDMNGLIKSELKLDAKTGWIIESNSTQQFKGDMHVGESPELPSGMTMTISMVSETVVTGHK